MTSLVVSNRRPVRAVLAALLAVAVAWAMPAAAGDGNAAPVGTIEAQTGTVTVLRGTERAALEPGQPVYEEDRIFTGQDARIKISFADRTTLVIGANSEVELSEYGLDGGNRLRAVLTVLIGIVRAAIVPSDKSGAFDIRTRTTVASARSTEWTVEAKADRTSVFVVEGRVEVGTIAGDAPVMLDAAFGTDVIGTNPPKAPVRWGAPRVADTLARTKLP